MGRPREPAIIIYARMAEHHTRNSPVTYPFLTGSVVLPGAADELIAVTGAELMPFELPGYTRAETQCQGDAGINGIRRASSDRTPHVAGCLAGGRWQDRRVRTGAGRDVSSLKDTIA